MDYWSRAEKYVYGLRRQDVMRYVDSWERLRPSDGEGVYNRWLFAIMSVRTTWQTNVRGFLACKDLGASFTRRQLHDAIRRSGAGLYDRRTEGVWELHNNFRNNPAEYDAAPTEPMPEARTRLANKVAGLGMAKTSFVFEMLFPLTCRVVCMDTHMLQLYGYGAGKNDDKPNRGEYERIERHWLTLCDNTGVPAPLARHMYWDKLQGKTDSLYWAWCLRDRHERTAGAPAVLA